MLDHAHVTLAHSVPFQIDPLERQLGDGGVRDFLAKPGVTAGARLLCLASSSLLASYSAHAQRG